MRRRGGVIASLCGKWYMLMELLIRLDYTERKFELVLQPKRYLQLRRSYLRQRTGSLLLRSGSLK